MSGHCNSSADGVRRERAASRFAQTARLAQRWAVKACAMGARKISDLGNLGKNDGVCVCDARAFFSEDRF